MQTLLINLTRFGDLIQTQPAISGLREQGQTPSLVCLDTFAPAAELLGGIESVAPLPGHELLDVLARDWHGALKLVWRWAKQYAPRTNGRVLNLTPAVSARLLARLLAGDGGHAAPVHGFSLDAHGFGMSGNPWAAFLLTSSNNRGCSPFNLADLLWKAASLPDVKRPLGLPQPSPAALQEAKELLDARAGERASRAKGFVALQLGASNERRRWPVQHFAALGRMLWHELKLLPVLTGGADEAALAARYLQSGAPGVDLAGRTSLEQLSGVLRHCRMLVTNDTGTMHLAAGLGTDVAALFLATAQPWDTGPCAPGALCLEPDLDCHPCGFADRCPHDHRCRTHIPAETVFGLVRARLETPSGPLAQGLDTTGARVWETVLDADHFLNLGALSDHENTDRTQWLRLQRTLYRQFLDSRPLDDPASWPQSRLSPATHAQATATLDQAGALLQLMAQQVALLARDPRQAVKNSFLATWKRIGDLWDASPLFNVLGLLWAAQSQESGQDMASIGAHVSRYAGLVAAWRAMLGQAPGMELE